MEIIVAKNNKQFLEIAEEYLNHFPERTQLLMANVTNEGIPLEKKYFRGVIQEKGQILLVFLNATPWNLQLYSEGFSPGAIDLLIHELIHQSIEFVGVQGNKEHTDYFIEKINQLVHYTFTNRLSMDIMRLDELKEVQLFGKIALATVNDVKAITEFRYQFYAEALHEVVKKSDLYDKSLDHLTKQLIYKYEEDHVIKSIAMISRKVQGGRAISLVYTPKEYRNKGYSSSLIYQLCDELLHQQGNEFVTLFVDKTNPVSNRVYEKVGFYISENSYDYVLNK